MESLQVVQPYTVGNTLTARMHKGINTTLDEGQTPVLAQPYTLAIRGRGDSHNFEYRQDGTANALLTPNGGRGGIGVGAIAHAFDARQSDVIQYGDKTGPLDTDGHTIGVAVAFHENQRAEITLNDTAGSLKVAGGKPGQGYPAVLQAVAWSIMPQNSGRDYKARPVDVMQPLMAAGPQHGNQGGDIIQTAMQVRRLTPRECERLQGFPDGYTAIPWRGKPASECPDGPRYKALGNSWAVPVVRWIGTRIDAAVRQA